MRHCYAQINELGLCTGVIDTHAPIDAPDMIPILTADPVYIGQTWTGEEWA